MRKLLINSLLLGEIHFTFRNYANQTFRNIEKHIKHRYIIASKCQNIRMLSVCCIKLHFFLNIIILNFDYDVVQPLRIEFQL